MRRPGPSRPSRRRRIAVLRALQLGDLLVAVPALRSLRAGFPDAEITLIGLPWAASFACRYSHLFDRFVAFPGWPGIAEARYDAATTARFLEEQRAYGYDLAIQLHGSGGASNPFTLALGARETAGYAAAAAGERGDATGGLTFAAPYPDDAPEVARNLRLMRLLGCPDTGARLEFPLLPDDHAEAERLLGERAPGNGPLVGVHPGARPPARRWPVESFAALGDALAERLGARLVITGGPDETATAQAVRARMRTPALDLAGKTSLGGLAAVMKRLDLFVSNDTGPAHLADALDVRSVTLFGPADVTRWAPLDAERHPIVRHPVPCSPCGYWECPIDHRCLRGVTPEDALRVAVNLLATGAVA